MKRLSIPLLITLMLIANAWAGTTQKQEVLIYSFTEQSTDYTCDFNGSDISQVNNLPWEKTTVKKTGFVALQEMSNSLMEVWFVNTYKAPDANGKMQKYAKPEPSAVYGLIYAEIGDKDTWLLSLDAWEGHIVLSGDEKHVFIKAVDKYANIPMVITGAKTWNRQTADKIVHAGSSTLTLKYHSKFTNAYYADPALLDAQYAVEGVIGMYLLGKGYTIIPLIMP